MTAQYKPVHLDLARQAVQDLLDALGFHALDPAIIETPERVARAYSELLAGYTQSAGEILAKRFEAPEPQIIALKDVSFTSMCEHHLMTFSGRAHVAYLPVPEAPPATRCMVIGVSKLARLVEMFARRLQLQERMGWQIARSLSDELHLENGGGVAVIIEAEHSCMACRGIKRAGATMVTQVLLGKMREDPTIRAETMSMLGRRQ